MRALTAVGSNAKRSISLLYINTSVERWKAEGRTPGLASV